GRDGVFRANQLQAKRAAKYAPQQTPASQPGAKPNNAPLNNAPLNNAPPNNAPPNNAPPNNAPLKSMTKVEPNASPGLSELMFLDRTLAPPVHQPPAPEGLPLRWKIPARTLDDS